MLLPKLIGFSYRNILKPIYFRFDPEFIHDRLSDTGRFLGTNRITKKITSTMFKYEHPMLEQEVHGITFKNPVGLSAGFDKEAKLQNILDDVGFGFMQSGSITLHSYEGNPPPRLYRLPNSKGLVVYYGLKNLGVENSIKILKQYDNPDFPISISVAKTNSTGASTDEDGAKDYAGTLKRLKEENIGDMYTINISCPNTFGGEPFTTPERLELLLKKVSELKIKKPVFVKMPINIDYGKEFKPLLDVIVKYNLQGVIIGNLNKDRSREEIKDDIPESINGGISGLPTWELSNNLISKTYEDYRHKLTIIGVGGIFSAEDAYEKIKRGATLVQLITGMVYQGPQLIGEINRGLVKLLKEDGYENISEAVGAYHK